MSNATLALVIVLVALAIALLVGSIYLRRRTLGAPSGAAAGTQTSATIAAGLEAEIEAAIPVEFQLAGASGEPPVLRATALDAEAFTQASQQARALNTRSGGVSRLAPILKAARLTAELAEQSAIRYLKVMVNGPLARSADGKSFRAFVLDGDGKLIEHQRLKDAGPLKFPFSGALLFQAVTVIVAQKHLKDISAQLTQIHSGIEQIREFQDRERRHEVLAIIDAMGQRIPEIQAGFLDDRWLQQLSANDQSLARIQGHLREEIQSAVARLGEITTGFWDAAKKRQEHIESCSANFRRAVSEWQIATEARILGWNLLVAFPGSAELKVERRRSIEREIGLLFADDGWAAKFDLGLREQVSKIQRLVRKADASRRRELLGQQQDDRRSEQRHQHQNLLQSIAAVMAVDASQEASLQLALKLEGDDIVEAYELAAQPTEPHPVGNSAAVEDSDSADLQVPTLQEDPPAVDDTPASAEAETALDPPTPLDEVSEAPIDPAPLAAEPSVEPLAVEPPEIESTIATDESREPAPVEPAKGTS